MIYVVAWATLAICSYILYFSRMEKCTRRWNGLKNYFRLLSYTDDTRYADEDFYAAFKITVFFMCLAAWPVYLLIVIRSYFIDFEAKFERALEEKE